MHKDGESQEAGFSKKRKLDLSDLWVEGKITTEEFLIRKEKPFLAKKARQGQKRGLNKTMQLSS